LEEGGNPPGGRKGGNNPGGLREGVISGRRRTHERNTWQEGLAFAMLPEDIGESGSYDEGRRIAVEPLKSI